MIVLKVNGKSQEVNAEPEVPLLWALREHLGLTGTKFGCGVGECGACTVHLDGAAVRSCQVPAAQAQGKDITTIEGLAQDHPVKKAWIAEQVPQCGYCQPGQIMQASAFLAGKPSPGEAEIVEAMRGNLCRCGTYPRIKRAVTRAAKGG
jgi:aerobic-type carbon monoxide dehydrogenase small subunit (CoxS/CutS family)